MNQNLQFIGYKSTPNDQYMLGIATILLYGKVILRYKHVQTKDGSIDFFTCPSYPVHENGEKKYLQAFFVDSLAEEEELMDFIRSGYKNWINKLSGGQQTASVFGEFTSPQSFAPSPVQTEMPF